MPIYFAGQEYSKIYVAGEEASKLLVGGNEYQPADSGTVTLMLSAFASGSFAGAFGQHRTPVGGGLLTPREFMIGGQTYGVRGWYTTSGNQIEINLDNNAQETAMIAAMLTIDLGQGNTLNTRDMSAATGALRGTVTTQYVSGQSYTITIRSG